MSSSSSRAARVRRGFVACVAAAACVVVPAVSSASSGDPADANPLVVVRFPAEGPLPYLDREVSGGWEEACKAPCLRRFAPGTRLRVRSRTGGPTSTLVLPSSPSSGAMVLDAEVGTGWMKGLGVGFLAASVASGVGTTLLLSSHEDRSGPTVMLGAATISFALSGVLFWLMGTSTLRVADDAPRVDAPAKTAKGGLRWSGSAVLF